MKMLTDKPVLMENSSENDLKDPKAELEILREITWLSPTDLPCPVGDRCISVHCVFREILLRMSAGEKVPASESMKYEMLRLATFCNCASNDKPFSILFARAGFYFADDKVICYVCGVCVEISSWKETENPHKIHKKYSPHCGFFVNNNAVNFPIPPLPPEYKAKFQNLDDLLESGEVQQPKIPQYSVLSIRLSTFGRWPPSIPQTAQMMAKCGFFYSGYGDAVRCYYCGVGLRSWEQEDDPLVEHCRWSKNCTFMQHLLSQGLLEGNEPQNMPRPALPSLQTDDDSGSTERSISSDQLKFDIAIQSVLEMGYSRTIIEAAINIIGNRSGKCKMSAQTIMETIFEIEEGLHGSVESVHTVETAQRASSQHNSKSKAHAHSGFSKHESGVSHLMPGKTVFDKESRETFRNAYRTPEQFGSSSSDEEEDDGTFYDAEDFGLVPKQNYQTNECSQSSSSEDESFYDACEDLSDAAYKPVQSETTVGAEAVRPTSRTRNFSSDSTSRKKRFRRRQG